MFVKSDQQNFYHLHNTHHTNLGTLTNQLCIPGEIGTDLSECLAFGRELFVVLFATQKMKR